MKTEETKGLLVEEGNKIIAEFMGCYSDTHWAGGNEVYRYGFRDTHITERWNESKFNVETPYHSSWDWLMPSVKKWNDLVISKRTGGEPGWTKWQYKTVMLRTEITPVFNDLVALIKWYKTQTK